MTDGNLRWSATRFAHVDIIDGRVVEKREIASSPRSSQLQKIDFHVIAGDVKNRAAISTATMGLLQQARPGFCRVPGGPAVIHCCGSRQAT
jgi:hypothetical protein